MDFDEPGWPLIDDFFRELAAGRSDTSIRRYARVHHRLVAFLDTADMTLGLGDERSALLDAEREFHDSGAFWTVWGPDELVECLPSFLHETWMPPGLGESRVQISVVSRLLAHLMRQRLLDGEATPRSILDVTAAIGQAQRALEARSAHPAGSQMPGRFLQPPGPEW